MKKWIALLLSVCMLLSIFTGCAAKAPAADAPAETPAVEQPAAQPEAESPADVPADEPAQQPEAPTAETVAFTDSLDRTVELPANLTRVAPSGAVASMIMSAIAPEYMVCISSAMSDKQLEYLPQELGGLPETGQLYGSKSTLNLEQLLACDPQVIIDLGDKKGNMTEDLDALQEQVGVPVIFIEADLPHMADAFRTLGTILDGKAERGEALGAFIADTVAMAEENAAKITDEERLSVMYTSGDDGLGTNAKGSIQAAVLDIVGAENAIVVEDVSNKGGGNIIDMEQLYTADPDVILFSQNSLYDTAADDPAWAEVRAIRDGNYAEIPGMPYNWLSNPPSFNMILGIWWLGNLLYPQYYDYDMTAKAQEIYQLFWNCTLSDEDAAAILSRAVMHG